MQFTQRISDQLQWDFQAAHVKMPWLVSLDAVDEVMNFGERSGL